MTGSGEEESRDTSWLLRIAAKPQLVRDALRKDRGLVKLLAANEGFLEAFFRSSQHLVALLDANERLAKEDVDCDALLERLNAGSDGAAESGASQSARLARQLRTLVADKKGRVFREHPELIASIAGNEAFAESLAGYDRVWEALLKKGKQRFGKDATLRQRIETALGKIIRFSYAGTLAEPDVGWEPPLALIGAAALGDVELVKEELAKPQTDPNLPNGFDSTALMSAAAHGHANCVRALLTHPNIEPNHVNNANSGWTALMFAAERSHMDCVRTMLSHPKTDPTCKNGEGLTAGQIARSRGYARCGALLAKAEKEWQKKHGQHDRA
jgi:ankyrin repeat protein